MDLIILFCLSGLLFLVSSAGCDHNFKNNIFSKKTFHLRTTKYYMGQCKCHSDSASMEQFFFLLSNKSVLCLKLRMTAFDFLMLANTGMKNKMHFRKLMQCSRLTHLHCFVLYVSLFCFLFRYFFGFWFFFVLLFCRAVLPFL